MKTTLLEMEKTFTPLSSKELMAIKGGDGIKLSDDQLKQMFDYSGAGGFDSTTSQTFNFNIRRMASTDAGASLLRSLANYATSKINISTANPVPGAAASYSPTTNTMVIGTLPQFNPVDPYGNSSALSTISHEMYHAFQDMFHHSWDTQQGGAALSIEIDPQIFSSKVLKQFDTLTGSNYYNIAGYGQYLSQSNTEDPAFVAAWNDVLNNPNFSMATYNVLVAGFKSSVMNSGGAYSWRVTDLKTDISQITIDDIIFNSGQMLLKNVPGGGMVITPVNPARPNFGADWDDSSPFNNPLEWGYDPSNGSFNDWYDFNTTNYDGDSMGSAEGPNGNYGGGNYYNSSGYVQEWYNADLQLWQYLSPGETALSGYEFVLSQDPNNPGGYDEWSCNPNGYGSDGFDINGYDQYGYNMYGFDQSGYDNAGYDTNGYNEYGYDFEGYDDEGYDVDGYDRSGNPKNWNY